MKVWEFLKTIPYGNTLSYKQVAQAIGMPYATRAIGNANNRNPISIIIPCHRVIGHNKSLTGYAAGIEKKQSLISLESENILL